MSDATTLAVPGNQDIALPVSPQVESVAAYPIPQSFAFAPQRWRCGVTQGTGGVGLLTMGLYLLSQIGTTPGLVIQIAILGSVCSIGGIALLWKTTAQFFGRLMIDESGIAVLPGFAGYSILWRELEHWDVNLTSRHPDGQSIRFWTVGSPSALWIPNKFLTSQDRAQIRHRLMHFAANKASLPAGRFGQ